MRKASRESAQLEAVVTFIPRDVKRALAAVRRL